MRSTSIIKKHPTPSSDLAFPRVRAEMSGRALRQSFRAIAAQITGRNRGILPMVKADAYGHGANWAASELLKLKSSRLEGFGVASLEEGAELRQCALGGNPDVRILCFSGAGIWSDEKRDYCKRYGLTPVFSSEEDFRRFMKAGLGELPYELKFDTGMHRLGIAMEAASGIARALARRPLREQPRGVLSHLAISEDPEAALTRKQVRRFAELRGIFAPVCPDARFHFSNSGAIWNERELGLARLTDFVRPGISLYGVPPWPGAPSRGLLPVMRVAAQIIMVRTVLKGESIGYGATYTAPRAVEIAVLSAGYADGLKRSLSNGGLARLGKLALPFRGIVSMDLSMVGATAGASTKAARLRVGEWVDVLGGEIDPWAQARAAGTIPYELLTSWSSRVERIYR